MMNKKEFFYMLLGGVLTHMLHVFRKPRVDPLSSIKNDMSMLKDDMRKILLKDVRKLRKN